MAVAFTVWNRPQYLRRVLDAWSRVRGVQDVLLQFWCEPGCEEVVSMCRDADFAAATHVHVNPARLTINPNTRQALDGAAEHSDYVILGCDDYLPADDILELNAWHRDEYRDDPTVLALVPGRAPHAAAGGPAAVWRTQLMGAVPGLCRDKWQLLSARWDEMGDHWWQWVDDCWTMGGPGYDILQPALSRVQDIGEVGSLGERSYTSSHCFSEHYAPQQYHEVTGKRERGWYSQVEDYS
jgi:hypothetical protein